MRMRKKKNLAPRMEACGMYLIKDPFSMRGRWRELMPAARELRVELGCGKGRFTAETAAAEPDVLLIAVEKVPDAMVVAMERARDAGLHNVFFQVEGPVPDVTVTGTDPGVQTCIDLVSIGPRLGPDNPEPFYPPPEWPQ